MQEGTTQTPPLSILAPNGQPAPQAQSAAPPMSAEDVIYNALTQDFMALRRKVSDTLKQLCGGDIAKSPVSNSYFMCTMNIEQSHLWLMNAFNTLAQMDAAGERAAQSAIQNGGVGKAKPE